MRLSAVVSNHTGSRWLGGLVFFACMGVLVGLAGAQHAAGRARLADVEQARAALFVLDEFLDTDTPLEELPRFYAPIVDYYHWGRQPLEAVLRDKAAYMRRWPDRRLRPDLGTLAVTTIGDGVFEVVIETDFEVVNDEARISGRSLVEIVLRRRGEGFEVTGEGGRVISRNK